MNLAELITQYPYMASPAALASADMGEKFKLPKHLDHMNRELVDLAFGDSKRLIVNAAYQHGKLLSHDTPMFTTKGWKTHGELVVGDEVFSPDGTPVRVEFIGSDGMADWEVETNDGHSIKCHGAHEWLVFDQRAGRKWRVQETSRMASRPIRRFSKDGNRFLFSLPKPLPLQLPHDSTLPVHPYALGAWLGDGQSDRAVLSHDADDLAVIRGVVDCGYPKTEGWVQKDTGVCYEHFSTLRAALREAGVLDNKHIPDRYLMTSESQRMDLLAGLIDTDGNYSRGSNQYRFINTNRGMIDQAARLARSLGFKVGPIQEYPPCVSSSGIAGTKTVYVVAFPVTRIIPCRLPRKLASHLCREDKPAIAAIRTCDPVPGRCIQVTGGLYLAGENLTCTHNSILGTIYFAAWNLLWNPDARVIIVGNEEDFTTNNFGEPVRDIIKRWGKPHGVNIKADSRAKGAWKVEGREGGVTCKGPHGGVVGRAADLFIIDDLIRNAEEALSHTIMESHWNWYRTTVQGRMRANTRLAIINTRWSRRDLCGRILAQAKITKEQWRVVKYKAVADAGDPLGRAPGEALWPEQVPLEQLRVSAYKNPFWDAAWQQEPRDEEGGHFSPGLWPRYGHCDRGWWMPVGGVRTEVRRQDVFVVISVDWAASQKKRSDYTCIGVYGITPQNNVLVLEIINDRFPLENAVPELEKACRKWSPGMVVVETGGFQDAVANECRRYIGIPEPRRVTPYGSTKLQRAYQAITLGQGGRIYLPHETEEPAWLAPFEDQLIDFTGNDDEFDDCVDSLAYFATSTQHLMRQPNYAAQGPCLLIAGREM